MYSPTPPPREDAVKCLVTKRWIKVGDPARWCEEMKGWVHPKGEEIIMEKWERNELDTDPLYRIIFADWQASDPDLQSGSYD